MSVQHEWGLEESRGQQKTTLSVSGAILSGSPTYQRNAPLWKILHFKEMKHVQTPSELLDLLASTPIDFVFLDLQYGRLRFLDSMKRTQPTIRFVFLIKESCPPTLVKMANRGYRFLYLEEQGSSERLAQTFLEQAFPRNEGRWPLKKITIEFETQGFWRKRWVHRLVDISTSGISWMIEQHDPCGAFLPGTVIHDLRIHRDTTLLVLTRQARIRHLSPIEVPQQPIPISCRVGAQFLVGRNEPTVAYEETLVKDRIAKTAIIEQGLKSSSLHLTCLDKPDHAFQGGGHIEKNGPRKSLFLYGEWPHDWSAGTVIHGTVEIAEWGYTFLTGIQERLDPHTLRVQFPATIKGVKQRIVPRHRLTEHSGIDVEFCSPFTDQTVRGQPLDISTQGFSLDVDKNSGPMPSGTYLHSILIYGMEENRAMPVSGYVRTVKSVCQQNVQAYRCGIEIEPTIEHDLLTTADAVTGLTYKGVNSGQGMPWKDLWAFFYDSKFLYPQKMDVLQPVLPQVQQTFATLVQDRTSPILRTLVVRSEDTAIEAHLSIVHAYTQTWIMQHLASLGVSKGNKYAVRNVYLGMVEVLSQLSNIRWLRAYFQPQKSFPDRIIGGFARRIQDRLRSNLTVYAYLTSSTDVLTINKENRKRLSVRAATAEDFHVLEHYFLSHGSLTEFLAEDGRANELELQSMHCEYQRCGLTRSRQVVVAEQHGHVCGVALMEFSSLGLNFSEITNRCTIHVWEQGHRATLSLAEYARGQYRQRGYLSCIVMVKPEWASVLTASGFTHARDYACWTLHRDLFPEYSRYIEKIFSTHF